LFGVVGILCYQNRFLFMLNRVLHLVLVGAVAAIATTALANPAPAPVVTATATTAPAKAVVINTSITEAEVLAAQKAWGDALVAISTTYETKGQAAAKALAEKVIDEAYGYQMGVVLFKPTLTVAPQTFRTTRAGALAYFVGGDAAFPKDTGFALRGWKKVEIQNAGILIDGDVATTMGNVMITGKDGKVTTVDKTWQFIKDGNGKLRIMLHHSSLPYAEK
jgi:hypothetical protein